MSFVRLGQLRRVRIVHALAALAAVAAVLGVSARTASAQVVLDSATHQRFSISPPLTGPHAAAAAGVARSCTTDCSPLNYYGGPVQHAERDYLFFWLPSGYSFPAGYESGLKTWLDGVAAADGTTGNPFSVNTQYYDTSGAGGSNSYVPYAVQDAGTIIDTDSFPATNQCTDTDGYGNAMTACLTDQQIQTELSSYVTANGLPTGLGVEYFVMTPQSVGSCFDSSSSTCSYTGYCGYHSYMSTNGGASQIVYADMPWAYQVPGCDVNDAFRAGYANAGGIDPVVSVFSHELSETMTDPELNAWLDSSGNEIGDKCAYMYGGGGYGSMSGLNFNSGYWNVPLTGGDYLMQTEYDERDSNCAVGLTTTWTGGWTSGTGWSQSGNWAGVLPPQNPVDTLVFPALTNPACTSTPATGTCYASDNNASNLTTHAITIDDGTGYSITGNRLSLGAGGITASTSASSPTASALNVPLTLGAPQTWTLSGATGGAGAGLVLGDAVSGPGDALGVDLSDQATLNLGGDDELGPVSVSGANAGESGSGAAQNGTLTTTSSLNGTDGAAVALSDVAMVTGATASTGPLTSTGASLQVGQGHAGALSVAGAVSLDPATQLTLFLDGPGTTPGSDYSQISATGAVSLSGALALASGTGGGCPTLAQGQVDTLITTTASLSGTFSGIPNGTLVTLPCGSGAPSVEINYTAHAVTATAISSAPSSLGAPTIAGAAAPGQTLIGSPGEWANAPTGIVDQWERCDASGANCAPIAGASGQQYTLTAADLGATIRIEEVASNPIGSSTAWSAPTALVAVPAPPVSSPPTSSPSPSAPASTSTPVGAPASASPADATPAPATASVRAALLEVLASAGKPARIGQLRAHGDYSDSISAPGAGVVVVSWSLKATKVVHAKRNAAAAVVIARGRAGSARAGALALKIRLTALGRQLLARRGKLTLTVTVTFTPAGSHQAVTTGRTFTIHR